jgi:hypothetical protein
VFFRGLLTPPPNYTIHFKATVVFIVSNRRTTTLSSTEEPLPPPGSYHLPTPELTISMKPSIPFKAKFEAGGGLGPETEACVSPIEST